MTARAHIPTLDGWRAVAITAVLASHGFILADSSSRPLRAVSYAAGHLGTLGVALFFAISGYLITTLLLEEREAAERVSLQSFYIRRAFRILPPAYLYLFALLVLGKPLAEGELASAALFFSNYWPDRQWFTQHFWSLSMEEHFYFLWPVALVWLGSRRAAIAAGVLIAAVAVWRPWSLAHMQHPFPALQRTDLRMDAFLYAGLLAIGMRSQHRARMEAWLSRRWAPAAAAMALGGATAWAAAGSAPSLATLTQSALLPVVLIWTILARGSWLHEFLERAPLRWMGRISYGLYLWQQFFLVGHSAETLALAALFFLPHVAAVFAAACVSYYLMERPLLRYGRRLAARVNAGPPWVSWNHEPLAPNSEGSAGIRPQTRSQTTGSSLH